MVRLLIFFVVVSYLYINGLITRCGACQRYAAHWKAISKMTKMWHSKVIRVAAINCGDRANDETCREHNILTYPTIKIFPAQASYESTDHAGKLIKTNTEEEIISEIINFLEQTPSKSSSWPELEPYTLFNLFDR